MLTPNGGAPTFMDEYAYVCIGMVVKLYNVKQNTMLRQGFSNQIDMRRIYGSKNLASTCVFVYSFFACGLDFNETTLSTFTI